MVNVDKTALYLEADEIDHLTIRYTDFGEHLNTEKGIKLITAYNMKYPAVNAALAGIDTSRAALSRLPEEEIYKILVTVRTVLLDKVF